MTALWQRLTGRERGLLLGGSGILVLALLYAFLWRPLDTAITRAQASVRARQADLAWMQQTAARLAALPPLQAATDAEPLSALIDRTTTLAGLNPRLRQMEPLDNGRYALRFEQVPFITFSAWLHALLREQGVKLEEASIERAGAEGVVNARLVVR